ncbi:MAG: heat-inducible transcription repressor HrcA, partial [Thermoleophilia bacterium]|nr:heat-inducible transcription repressor HrcA [Thermoleophilia bacterium]
ALVDSGSVDASASTVRHELGGLEQLGLLEHPHTSAGRVPTDLGYRTYVDQLLDSPIGAQVALRHAALAVADDPHARIDEALRATTQQLADATGLLAVITAPRASGAVIRHVEVLQLQPALLIVVVITAAGDVVRHVVPTETAVDPGLVDWAGAYLNEQVAGMSIGQSMLRQRLDADDVGPRERAMLNLLLPAFQEVAGSDGQELHVGGSASVLAELGSDVQRVLQLVAMLDERRRLLEALRPIGDAGMSTLRVRTTRLVNVRIGEENAIPELHRLSVIGAPYGVGGRPLGMVGLIGPRAMDYTLAIGFVHLAAGGLSDKAEELYAD